MACTSGSVWASRHTLPAPCRQQHRYLTQHVSSLSLSVSLHLWSPICNHLRLCSASALNEKYLRTPALSKLMSTVQGQISSQPEPQHFQIDLKGSGRVGVGWGGGLLGMLVIFVAVQSFQTEMHSWRRGRRAWFEPASKRLSCPPPLLAENTEPHPGLSQ